MKPILPRDNILDLTKVTRELEKNAEMWMERISKHARDENEKLNREIVELKFKVLCLEAIVESLMPKPEDKCTG